MLPHNIKEIFMDACVAVKLRMERGYKLVALLGSNDMSSHFCKNPCVAVNLLYVWSTDECHWDIIADTFNRVVFVSQGYTIGLGEQMQKVFQKLN